MSQYVTPEELKKTLTMTGTTFADYDIEPAIVAASDALNEICGRRRFDWDITDTKTRYYKPKTGEVIVIDDLVECIELVTDQDSDGEFEYLWTQDQNFFLWPLNSADDGRPYTQIHLNTFRANVGFPYWARRGVKLTGKFGWPTQPSFLEVAAKMLAARLIKRMREAPFGVVTVGLDVGSAIRIGRTDPDIMGLCEPYTREPVV